MVDHWVAVMASASALDDFNDPPRAPPKTCLMTASAAGDMDVLHALLRYGARTREWNVLMSIGVVLQ